MRMSGASGRTGCIMCSGPDGQPQTERPRAFFCVDTSGAARSALDEHVERRAATSEWRARPERERRFPYALVPREERQLAPADARAHCELRTHEPRTKRVDAESEIPGILRRRATRAQPVHARPER